LKNLVLLSSGNIKTLSINTLVTIGGAQSSGVRISSLKSKDDYSLVVPGENEIVLHPLKGKKKGPVILKDGEIFAIEDLIIGIAAEQHLQDLTHVSFIKDYEECIQSFSGAEDLFGSMNLILDNLTRASSMEKGLIILKNQKGGFDLIIKKGIEKNDSWLSEKLIQTTLATQKPHLIQNVIGSPFEGNRSLIASGFISIATWPLVVRGESLGVLVIGSTKPHSGLSEDLKKHGQNLAQLSALMLWFQLREAKLREEVKHLRQTHVGSNDSPFLTTDPKLISTVQLARQVSPTKLSAVIQGETGVGKELLSKWIHDHSDRKDGPFVAVNCGAIPGELLESILFGHKKGSFTGATNDQVGKFQTAHNGTLFLDEIGDLPEKLQVKLLRALQEKVVEPLGSNKPIPVDVRVIAATHKTLSQLVQQKTFREDLYFRLAEVVVVIPPLRDRPADIGPLATEFLKSYLPEGRLSTQAWNWLKSREWRGNGRELLSSIKRAAVLSTKLEIEIEDLTRGEPVGPQANGSDGSKPWLGGETLEDAKTKFILSKVELALQQADGQRTKAAELLGVTPRTLFRYLENKGEELTEPS
jgi:DNA-binding NtrC family response regulator